MTSAEGNMLTMRIIKLLGIAGVAVLAAVYIASRTQRREQDYRRRLAERLERNDGKARVAPAALVPPPPAPSPRIDRRQSGAQPREWLRPFFLTQAGGPSGGGAAALTRSTMVTVLRG